MTGWTEFDGRVEVLSSGPETGAILRLPPSAIAALGGVNRVEGEVGGQPVDTVIVRVPDMPGAFLRIGQDLCDRAGIVPGATVAVRLRPKPVNWPYVLAMAVVAIGGAFLKMAARQLP